jgi:hypothetical protein
MPRAVRCRPRRCQRSAGGGRQHSVSETRSARNPKTHKPGEPYEFRISNDGHTGAMHSCIVDISPNMLGPAAPVRVAMRACTTPPATSVQARTLREQQTQRNTTCTTPPQSSTTRWTRSRNCSGQPRSTGCLDLPQRYPSPRTGRLKAKGRVHRHAAPGSCSGEWRRPDLRRVWALCEEPHRALAVARSHRGVPGAGRRCCLHGALRYSVAPPCRRRILSKGTLSSKGPTLLAPPSSSSSSSSSSSGTPSGAPPDGASLSSWALVQAQAHPVVG